MKERTRTIEWQDPVPLARSAAGRSGLEFLEALRSGELPPPPIMATIGYELVELGEGRAVFRMEPAEFHYNVLGGVHGGVISTLLDTAMGCAVQTLLPAGRSYTTLELKVNFVRGLKTSSGPVTASGTVVNLGRRVATAEGRLESADGTLYAHATTTCLILEMEPRG